jgi:hypothetical protein
MPIQTRSPHAARRHVRRIASLALATALAAVAAPAQIGPGGPPQVTPPPTPPKFVHGPVTWLVTNGMVTHLPTGNVWTNDIDCDANQSIGQYALAFALRRARPNDVLQVTGTVAAVHFVPTHSPCKKFEAGWNSNVMRDVTIVGADSSATILGQIEIQGRVDIPGQGGVDRLTFENLRLRVTSGGKAPLLTHETSRQGLIRFYGCDFQTDDPAQFSGNGMMWACRGALASWDARENTFVRAQEHLFYIDSPGWNGAYDPSFIFVDNVGLDVTGRTGIHLVNRPNPSTADPSYVGSPGLGDVLIRTNTMTVNPNLVGGGGSVITIAGHWGEVFVEHNIVQAIAGPNAASDSGGIIAWTPGDTWIMASGYATKYFYVRNNTVFGTGQRTNIGAAGCEVADIGFNTLMGAGDGIVFEGTSAGAIGNRIEALPPSTMSGWLQGAFKAKDKINGVLTVLTDTQIDNDY